MRTGPGASHASSASVAAGRSTSAAYSETRSTSICSSSVGVRSKTPVRGAGGTRVPGRAADPARANVRLAVVTERKPVRVTVKTACSACLRSPTRSRRSLWASRLRPATTSPMGSRDSEVGTP
ncbi:hypothetical protein [Nocardioides aquaticus]|uniref:hypothetical protein n=1 Tax=Nocardioides aquaticus TaxID=160826 RepID=UPI003B837CFD